MASDITGVSEQLMLPTLIDRHEDLAILTDLARGRRRSGGLTEALTIVSSDHQPMTALHLHRINAKVTDIDDLDARIEEAIPPFRFARELLMSIPGTSTTASEVFIAETRGEMAVFPTVEHLASWSESMPGPTHPPVGSNRLNPVRKPVPGTESRQ